MANTTSSADYVAGMGGTMMAISLCISLIVRSKAFSSFRCGVISNR